MRWTSERIVEVTIFVERATFNGTMKALSKSRMANERIKKNNMFYKQNEPYLVHKCNYVVGHTRNKPSFSFSQL